MTKTKRLVVGIIALIVLIGAVLYSFGVVAADRRTGIISAESGADTVYTSGEYGKVDSVDKRALVLPSKWVDEGKFPVTLTVRPNSGASFDVNVSQIQQKRTLTSQETVDGSTKTIYRVKYVLNLQLLKDRDYTAPKMVVSGGSLESQNIGSTEYTSYVTGKIADLNGKVSYTCENAWSYVPLPPPPSKEGHTFSGWYLDPGCTELYTGETVRDDITLYAGWTVNRYTVSYNVNGGNAVSNDTAEYNTVVYFPQPTRLGYTFVNWKDASGTVYNASIIINKNLILIAEWQLQRYTVRYYVDGVAQGDGDQYDYGTSFSQVITYPAPPSTVGMLPSKNGTVSVWMVVNGKDGANHNTNLSYQEYSVVVNDPDIGTYTRYMTRYSMSLSEYSEYTAFQAIKLSGNIPVKSDRIWSNAYEFYVEGSYNDTYDKFQIDCGNAWDNRDIAAAPMKVGHSFDGWYLDMACTQLYRGEVLTSDIQLHGKFSVNRYTISINLDGGSGMTGSVTGDYGTNPSIVTPWKTGYNFVRWESSGVEYNPSTAITDSITIVAIWEIKVFTVKFIVDGVEYRVVEVSYGTSFVELLEEAKLQSYNMSSVAFIDPTITPESMQVLGDAVVDITEKTSTQQLSSALPGILGIGGGLIVVIMISSVIGKFVKRSKRKVGR